MERTETLHDAHNSDVAEVNAYAASLSRVEYREMLHLARGTGIYPRTQEGLLEGEEEERWHLAGPGIPLYMVFKWWPNYVLAKRASVWLMGYRASRGVCSQSFPKSTDLLMTKRLIEL